MLRSKPRHPPSLGLAKGEASLAHRGQEVVELKGYLEGLHDHSHGNVHQHTSIRKGKDVQALAILANFNCLRERRRPSCGWLIVEGTLKPLHRRRDSSPDEVFIRSSAAEASQLLSFER